MLRGCGSFEDFLRLARNMAQLLRVLHRSRAVTYGRNMLVDIRLQKLSQRLVVFKNSFYSMNIPAKLDLSV